MSEGAAMQRGQRRLELLRTSSASLERDVDEVVVEEPLEIRAAGPGQEPMTLVTTLRTPGHEAELAVGWLFSEELASPGEIADIAFGDPVTMARPDDQVTVHLMRRVDVAAGARRHAMATASCGVCGRAAIDELALRCAAVATDALTDPPVDWSVLATLPDRLRDRQAVFGATGGLHAAGVFEPDGTLVTLREDVGRHNALDAAIGAHVLAADVPLTKRIVVLSGRIGFELVAKAAAAGAAVVAAVGAPTDLAIRTANQLGITLVGFLRHGSGNVYTHPHRLDVTAASTLRGG